jgi:hypothetical protein
MWQNTRIFELKLIKLKEINLKDIFSPCNKHLCNVYPIQQDIIKAIAFWFCFLIHL